MTTIHAFKNAGYDYSIFHVSGFDFPVKEVEQKASRSINDGAVIVDQASFESCNWQNPAVADYDILKRIATEIPKGMKLVVAGPCGVLENAIRLVGYDNLCYMIIDNPQLAFDVFEEIGSSLVKYYTNIVKYDVVGGIISNDDWGFKSQTLLPPEDMQLFVFPWHKEIVSAAHAAGQPAILHSLYCEMDFEKQTRKRKSQENSIINIQHGIFNIQVKKRARKVFGENRKPKTAMKKYNKIQITNNKYL